MRDASDVYYAAAQRAWYFLRFDEIREGIRDPRLSMDPRNAAAETGHRAMTPLAERGSMAFIDPPDHTRLRRLVSHAFSPKFVETLRPAIERVADELLSTVATGPFDFAASVARPLSRRVVGCIFLGLDVDDLPGFVAHLGDAVQIFNPTFPKEKALAARERMKELWLRVVESRREERGHDFVSVLLDGQDGDRLTESEMVEMLIMTFGAGNLSTAEMMNLAVFQLLQAPAELAKVRANLALLPDAVEESLRCESATTLAKRVAPTQLELGGCTIAAGDTVSFMTSVAARDPAVNAEPLRFDVTRDRITHLAFGGGPHVCAGAALARLETEVVLGALLRHCPTVRLDPDRAPERKRQGVITGLKDLWLLPQ